MMSQNKTKWNAIDFVRNEVDDVMNLYGNTECQAVEFVIDMLEEDQWTDLKQSQRESALWVARKWQKHGRPLA